MQLVTGLRYTIPLPLATNRTTTSLREAADVHTCQIQKREGTFTEAKVLLGRAVMCSVVQHRNSRCCAHVATETYMIQRT